MSLNYAEPLRSPLIGAGRCGELRQLLRGAARRVVAGRRPQRDAVSAGDLGAGRDGRRGIGVDGLARYFEYWLLRLQGVYPPHVACHRCGEQFAGSAEGGAWLSPSDGILTCAACADGAGGRRIGTRLTPGALAFLASVRAAQPVRAAGLSTVSDGVLAELEALHRRADGASPRARTSISARPARDAARTASCGRRGRMTSEPH